MENMFLWVLEVQVQEYYYEWKKIDRTRTQYTYVICDEVERI